MPRPARSEYGIDTLLAHFERKHHAWTASNGPGQTPYQHYVWHLSRGHGIESIYREALLEIVPDLPAGEWFRVHPDGRIEVIEDGQTCLKWLDDDGAVIHKEMRQPFPWELNLS